MIRRLDGLICWAKTALSRAIRPSLSRKRERAIPRIVLVKRLQQPSLSRKRERAIFRIVLLKRLQHPSLSRKRERAIPRIVLVKRLQQPSLSRKRERAIPAGTAASGCRSAGASHVVRNPCVTPLPACRPASLAHGIGAGGEGVPTIGDMSYGYGILNSEVEME